MKIRERIGGNIRRTRMAKDITQKELAKICGFSTAMSISFIERGKRSIKIEQLVLIAGALGTSPGELL